MLIKNNVTRNIDTASGNFETLNPLMTRTITNEETLSGMKSEFALVIWMKVRPTCTSKNTEGSVIWAST
jgi:hypothetical protein